MNILHINSYFSTSGLYKQLYDRQVNKGLNIDVYVPVPFQYPDDRLAASGLYTNVSRNHQQLSRWVFPIKHYAILKDLKQSYDFERYDLVHAHSLFSNGWLALQLKKEYGLPYIVAVRNADLRTFFQRMPWMKQTGLTILNNAEQIIFISKNTYNEVYDKYIPQKLHTVLKDKSQIIPNGVADYWHDNKYTEKDSTLNHPLRIVTTGKVMKIKRFVQLAEMTADYSTHIYPAELHIIGPNWDDDVLKQLEAMPNVIYHGSKTQAEMAELYRQMDIFALLSYPETFGLVYVEAMSQSLPVIYTAGEGFDNFFPSRTIGVSVNRKDQIQFNNAVDYIVQNYKSISHNAVNSIGQFDWDRINQLYIELYQQISKEIMQ